MENRRVASTDGHLLRQKCVAALLNRSFKLRFNRVSKLRLNGRRKEREGNTPEELSAFFDARKKHQRVSQQFESSRFSVLTSRPKVPTRWP
jgi:hypothetical protein